MKKITIKTRGMESLSGVLCKSADLPEYTFFSHLVDFEGPLISLFKGKQDIDALFQWVDSNDSYNRWCIIPVKRADLNGYLAEKFTLKELIEKAVEVTYLNIKTVKDDDLYRIFRRSGIIVNVKDIPEDYMPRGKSFLFDSICTQEALTLKSNLTSEYSLGINNDLYIDDLSIIPRKFLELYSFHYALSHLEFQSIREKVFSLTSGWRGGISVVNMFSGMSNLIPTIHKPRVVKLAYNSPGVIKLNLMEYLADEIKIGLLCSMDSERRKEMDTLYKSTYKFFRENGISGFDDENSSSSSSVLTQSVSEELQRRTLEFIDLLCLDAYRDYVDYLGSNSLQRIKTILSYYRRFKILSDYQIEEKLLVGTDLSVD